MTKPEPKRDAHIYLAPSTYDKLAELAKRERRSLAGQAEIMLEKAIAEESK